MLVAVRDGWIKTRSDGKDGRSVAERAGCVTLVFPACCLRATKEKQTQLVTPEIQAPRTSARFFVSSRLQAEALAFAGE